eukprot:Plantae.Rhodophyta-Purpureofilum_apyrenoidigerum.ctg19975.p1 GENE.Plantae.Rhodophyta-Purpureofilum_apyrenoidigerum.ctg19975~~Plantae.Rhodophyta-Purpureofilum_apyrenoidigerum.ctg19975.p1  ORF type:complete len:330 (-),score=47.50 Plantae.Rhodophyta-Purpureofilum_apyrenoidigerum.ctg19975:1101-2090(-)
MATLESKEADIQKMVFATTHVGTKNCNRLVEPYVFRRRISDGTNYINLGKTFEKIHLAARIIATIENPQDVIAVCSRITGQRAVLKFAQFTGCRYDAGRWTPGQLTNQICQKYVEPRLLICNDPYVDSQPIKEASYVGCPVIAFCNTDSPLEYVDVAIPGNTKAVYSVALLWYLLTREVLYLKGEIPRGEKWDVMVDLFFYRDPAELENAEEQQGPGQGVVAPAETYDVSTFDPSAYPDPAMGSGPTDWVSGGDTQGVSWDTAGATDDWNAVPQGGEDVKTTGAQIPQTDVLPDVTGAQSWEPMPPSQQPQQSQQPQGGDSYGQDFDPQ